jgi:D-serine deaminase-like pyridoxal phosphate-dependent protein
VFNADAVAALSHESIDWRFKGLPVSWSGLTPGEIRAASPNLFDCGPLGPICVVRADALNHNLSTMSSWCSQREVELAPHGKTHMAPQLAARQLAAGAWGITVATISQVRTMRAFGVQTIVLANELVDPAGLRWLANELDTYDDFRLICWVDSVPGVQLMDDALTAAGAGRPVDVCVEIGASGGRSGCRDADAADAVAAAAAASPKLRLVGVSGYEAALGHDVSCLGTQPVRDYLTQLRSAVLRLAPLCEDDEIIATAGGSTHFDLVTDLLTGHWPLDRRVRTVLRSGAYLTHDDGLYSRTSPLTRPGAEERGSPALRPALEVWAQVCSLPEPGLALLTMGRRDVSFDQDLPVPIGLQRHRHRRRHRLGEHWSDGSLTSRVTKLNDQHAYLALSHTDEDRIAVGSWIRFGISHPCTVFDKWPLIPVLDADDRVVDLVRTFF